MYQQALAGYGKALGPDHTSTLEHRHSPGRQNTTLDEYPEELQQGLQICHFKTLGSTSHILHLSSVPKSNSDSNWDKWSLN
jgi:hypothetical protein